MLSLIETKDPKDEMGRVGGSHNSTLTLVLFANFGARDTLSCFQTRFRAAFLEIFEPLAGFGEVLCYGDITLVDVRIP
jgi:hypothetical protein